MTIIAKFDVTTPMGKFSGISRFDSREDFFEALNQYLGGKRQMLLESGKEVIIIPIQILASSVIKFSLTEVN